MQKKIFTICQRGIKSEYVDAVQDGIREFMDIFPDYKNDYNITYLGSWHSDNAYTNAHELLKQPKEIRKLYIPTNGGGYLVPYESTDWAIAVAKMSAISHNRPHQINAGLLLDLINSDPTVAKVPQLDVSIVKDDAFCISNGRPNNFVYAIGKMDKGFVLSTHRLEQMYGDNRQFLREVIKTLTIHELGHVFNATFKDRHNVANNDNYGYHCNCPGCAMRTDTRANPQVLTNDRLERARKGIAPLCPECVAAVKVHMAKIRGNEEELKKAADYFNLVRRSVRDYS